MELQTRLGTERAQRRELEDTLARERRALEDRVSAQGKHMIHSST
ncbi:hypothetical protein [Sphaerisporangium sp. NPDC051011]